MLFPISFFFFFNDTATTEIYTLSLHDALPIYHGVGLLRAPYMRQSRGPAFALLEATKRMLDPKNLLNPGKLGDRKSTRLNSSHTVISYAVFCLKKKKSQFRYVRSRGFSHSFFA